MAVVSQYHCFAYTGLLLLFTLSLSLIPEAISFPQQQHATCSGISPITSSSSSTASRQISRHSHTWRILSPLHFTSSLRSPSRLSLLHTNQHQNARHQRPFPSMIGVPQRRRTCTTRSTSTTSTCRHMVFTAPEESVLEQLSTQDIIDKILDECLLTQARRPIMKQFNPSAKYIWKHWTSSVYVETWKAMVKHLVWCMLVYAVFQKFSRVKYFFSGLNGLYPQLLSITTFTVRDEMKNKQGCVCFLNMCSTCEFIISQSLLCGCHNTS